MHKISQYNIKNNSYIEASRGAAAQSLTVNRLVVGSIPIREDEIYTSIYISNSSFWCRGQARSSVTQRAMPPEYGKKWGTECLNTRYPTLCLPCSVREQREADI